MRTQRIIVFVGLCAAALAAPLRAQPQDTAKRTRTIRLTERAGIARSAAPIEITVRFERDLLKDAAAVRLFQVGTGGTKPIAIQVLGTTQQAANDSFASVPQTFVHLVFLADVPAG